MCLKDSLLPVDGFPVNEMAAQMVSEQPKEVYRGKELRELKTNLDSLEELNLKLFREMNNGSMTINDHCNHQIACIDSTCAKQIEEINRHRDLLTQQVDEYRQQCNHEISGMSTAKEKTKEIINRVNGFLEEQRNLLNQMQIEDRQIVDSNEMLTKLRDEVSDERENVKNAIFINKPVEFVHSTKPVDMADLIGSFNSEKVQSSKAVKFF